MATVVNIQLLLDESGALTGMRNLDLGLRKVTGSVQELDSVGKAAFAGLDGEARSLATSWGLFADKAEQGNKKVADSFDRVKNKAALARYEAQEMGLRLPRYLASIVAACAPVMGVLSAMSGVMVGIGVISMFGMAIKEAREFYDTHLSLTHAMDEYIQKAGQASQQKLFDTASIETTAALLASVNAQLDEIDRRRKAEAAESLETDPDVAMAKLVQQKGPSALEDAKTKPALLALKDPLADRQAEQNATRDRERLAADNEYRTAVAGKAAKASVEYKNAELEAQRKLNVAKAEETRLFERQQTAYNAQQEQIKNGKKFEAKDLIQAPVRNEHAGESQYHDDLYVAKQKRSAQQVEIARTEQQEISRMQDEALNVSLRGEELYAAKKTQEQYKIYEQVIHGHLTEMAARQEYAQLDLRFDSEKLQRLREQESETTKLEMQSRVAGLTGAAKISAEGDVKQSDLLNDVWNGKVDPAQYARRAIVIERETTALIAKDQQDFFDHVNELSTASADHQVSGFARIRAEAQKEFAELDKTFREHTANLGEGSPEYQRYAAALGQGRSAITQSAAMQSTQLTEKNADETLKLEEEARRKSLRGEAEKTQAIYDEYQDRVRKYKAQLRDQEISQQDFDRRMIAAEQEKNNALKEQAKETREKMAGELSGFFKNPSQWMQGLGEKAMSQTAAGMLLKVPGMDRLANDKGGIMGSLADGSWLRSRPVMSHTALMSTAIPNAPDVMNLPGMEGRNLTALNPLLGAPKSLATPALAQATAAAVMNLPTATISIGSATISVGATGAMGAGAGGAGIIGANSTVTASPAMSGIGAQMASGAAGTSGTGSSTLAEVSGGIGFAKRGAGILAASGVRLPAGIKLPALSSPSASSAFDPNVESSSNSTKLPNSAPDDPGTPGSYSPDYAGAAAGGMGLYGAFMGTGGVGGTLGGAMSGAEVGMAFGGPWGAAAGAVVGGVLGAFGFGGRMQAEKYWDRQGRPHLDTTARAFDDGQMDYLSAYADLESLQIEADTTTKKMGPSAHDFFNDTIKKAITGEESTMTRQAKAGRSQITMSAAQYHGGGMVDNFGHLSTSADEGLIHARIGEFMVKPSATRRNRPALEALNSGASMERVAASYQSTMASSRQQRGSGSAGRDVNFHFYSHDARGARDLFFENKHVLRAALNESYDEYSGGSDFE